MGSGTFRVRLHVLTPLHIGCGQDYEPTSFVVDKPGKRMIVFDPFHFVRGLPDKDRAEFLRICGQGTLASILDIYRFLDRHAAKASGREIGVCDGFLANHRQVLNFKPRNDRDLKDNLNRFAIGRTAYNPLDGSAYVPGSALKGALRTGYLNDLGRLDPLPGVTKDLEERLMGGSFENDPFRLVRVSDFIPVGVPRTKVLYAINRKKKISEMQSKGPPHIVEAILPGSVFEGRISVQEKPPGATMRHSVCRETFFQSVSAFFDREMKRERDEMGKISMRHEVLADMSESFGDALGRRVFPVRLGRHCGAESVTIDGHRNIEIRMGKGDSTYKNHATTLWLAAERKDPASGETPLPFGWAALELLPPEDGYAWPERVFESVAPVSTGRPAAARAVVSPKSQEPPPEPVVWERALVTWSPGNQTLKAVYDGKRAEIRCSKDDPVVAEALRKKIFSGKEARARVSVEPYGNAFRIVKIEPGKEQ